MSIGVCKAVSSLSTKLCDKSTYAWTGSHVQHLLARSFEIALLSMVIILVSNNASYSADYNEYVRRARETFDGLKIVFFIFVAIGGLFLFLSVRRPVRQKKRRAKGPIGGSHAIEGMILGGDGDNVLVRHAARRLPLGGVDAARTFSDHPGHH